MSQSRRSTYIQVFKATDIVVRCSRESCSRVKAVGERLDERRGLRRLIWAEVNQLVERSFGSLCSIPDHYSASTSRSR